MIAGTPPDGGAREKLLVAASSVVAAVVLTAAKLATGLATGSLGILSEALHSGLDLVAALVTLVAVRASARPADRQHAYGHGKVENLSALFETLLLLATCGWIVVEAVERLAGDGPEVQASLAAFLVMGGSIIVDASRARALRRVAARYNSQALEADALHFSTDVWSSLVVILGLGLVYLSGVLGVPWLARADAAAALGVAVIVVLVSIRLGRRALGDLLDEAPPGLAERIAAAARVEGVLEVRRPRVRMAGPQAFVDVTLSLPRGTSLPTGHTLAHRAEDAVKALLPGADVTVHMEPAERSPARPLTAEAVQELASEQGLRIHDVRLTTMPGPQPPGGGTGPERRSLELHLEVPEDHCVASAHSVATAFEAVLHRTFPALERVVTHIEPQAAGPIAGIPGTDHGELRRQVEDLSARVEPGCTVRALSVRRRGELHDLTITCLLAPETPITAAHGCTERIERALRADLVDLGSVLIHVEPSDPARPLKEGGRP